MLSSPGNKHPNGLPVLEPIKIQSTEDAEDESSESEVEDEMNFEVTNDSDDDDSEPEVDREIKRTRDEDGMNGRS